jgi:predicted ATPase
LGTAPDTRRFQGLVTNLLTFRLNPWSIDLAARREHRMLNVGADNLVGFLRSWSQEDPEAFVAWKRRALTALPALDDLQLRELEAGSRMLLGTKVIDGNEVVMGLDSFSEGERALLVLHAIAGIARRDRLIALDEPDNFLAPSEVQPILREFTIEPPREAAQLLVVTHHPETIDFLASYSTWLFEKGRDGLARVRKLEFDREAGERPTESLLAELAT